MNYSSSTAISRNMPRVGFEPTHKRFLRPPPLPLGYRDPSTALRAGRISAPGRTRTCNNVILDHAPLPKLGYQSIHLIGRRRELNPHFLVAGQESCH
jgi:hypothetical protein